MQTTSELLDVSNQIVSEVKLLSAIAKANGSLASLRDVVNLSQFDVSEEELVACWDNIPGLAPDYQLKNGLILERTGRHETELRVILNEAFRKKARAEEYARLARKFASLCNRKDARLIAISGSTSYGSVSPADDLDFFCITKPNALWIFLTKSLVVARLLQITRRRSPRICFSYMIDENFAHKEFLAPKDSLFARDALTAKVIQGEEFYQGLLKKSSWIRRYYPRLHQQLTTKTSQGYPEQNGTNTMRGSVFLNLLLLFTVGRYIALKSFILNRKLRKGREIAPLFTVRLGPDHCIFESIHYSKLRLAYASLEQSLPANQQSP